MFFTSPADAGEVARSAGEGARSAGEGSEKTGDILHFQLSALEMKNVPFSYSLSSRENGRGSRLNTSSCSAFQRW